MSKNFRYASLADMPTEIRNRVIGIEKGNRRGKLLITPKNTASAPQPAKNGIRRNSQAATFTRKTAQLWQTARKRTKNGDLQTLADFRKWLSGVIGAAGWVACPYCRERLTIAEVSLDHILPISQGGDNSAENLQVVCRACNKCRSAMPAAAFAEFCAFLDGLDVKYRASIRANVFRYLALGMGAAMKYQRARKNAAKP